MCAAFGSTEPLANVEPPAGADFHAGQLLEIYRDIATGRVRAFIGFSLGINDHHIEINGQAYPHIMHGLAGLTNCVAVAPCVYIRFGIDQMCFDVPQAVVAFVAYALDGARVHGLTGLGW